jgi:hypothetical protein
MGVPSSARDFRPESGRKQEKPTGWSVGFSAEEGILRAAVSVLRHPHWVPPFGVRGFEEARQTLNEERRAKNGDRRTKNREPRTANVEPRTSNERTPNVERRTQNGQVI